MSFTPHSTLPDLAVGHSGTHSSTLPPRHLEPTLSSTLPNYSNTETDRIRAAFHAHNFTTLSNALPDTIAPESILMARESRRISNLNDDGAASFKPVARGGSLNPTFTYVPSKYSLLEDLKKLQRTEHEAKVASISAKPWAKGSTKSLRLKHEEQFGDSAEPYRYPHMDDLFEAAEDQNRRMRWLQEQRVIHGPFVQSAAGQSLSKPSRKMIPEIVQQLHRVLKADWEESNFSVCATEDDLVVCAFDPRSVPSVRALTALCVLRVKGYKRTNPPRDQR